MQQANNISTLGFFNYFKKIVGAHIYGYLAVNFLVGLFDGLGLAMFVPLLSIATGSQDSSQSLGKLHFVVDAIKFAGFELNLITALGFMVLLFILKGVMTYFRSLYITKIRLMASRKIRFSLVDGLNDLSYQGYTKLDAGRIQNVMIGEINRMTTAMNQYFASTQNIIMLITYLALATMSNWQFAILVAIGGFLTNFAYSYINKITKRKAKDLSLVGHIFNGDLIQAINYFKYLKATNTFQIYSKKLKGTVERGEVINFKLGKIGAFAESIREPMIIIVIAAVILIQVQFMSNNFGSILVALLLFYRALSHLVLMQNQWNGFLGSAAGLDSVEHLLADFSTHKEHSSNHQIQTIGNLQTEHIHLSLGEKEILKDINLHISKNTSVAFVGESGAGKTSLANVLSGIQPPTSGKILVNGEESLYTSDLNSFRDKIGYIAQEPVIFDDTVFNNITLWSDYNENTLEKFRSVIDMVSLTDFLEANPLKEHTPLGNNGILVSGGQKQRISIARELFKNVDVLVMDEATSALDSETEKYIKDNIDMLHGRFTMIIIAHRLSTIRNVDHIYLMENGKITDSGNYHELIQSSAKFRRMVELQEV